jgi:hypothetical protein
MTFKRSAMTVRPCSVRVNESIRFLIADDHELPLRHRGPVDHPPVGEKPQVIDVPVFQWSTGTQERGVANQPRL